ATSSARRPGGKRKTRSGPQLGFALIAREGSGLRSWNRRERLFINQRNLHRRSRLFHGKIAHYSREILLASAGRKAYFAGAFPFSFPESPPCRCGRWEQNLITFRRPARSPAARLQ